jgi:hypothetical protein
MSTNGTSTTSVQAGYIAKLKDSTDRASIRFVRITSFGVTLADVASLATAWDDPTEAWKYAELASQEFGMAFVAIPVRDAVETIRHPAVHRMRRRRAGDRLVAEAEARLATRTEPADLAPIRKLVEKR